MKKALPFVLIAIMLFGLVACTQPVSSEVLQSDKQRVTSPVATQAGLATLVDGNSAFAFNLYQALKETDDNLFYSPYSISLALAMTYAGARGETEEQMANTLHFTLEDNRLHPAFSDQTEERIKDLIPKGAIDELTRLVLTNAIYFNAAWQYPFEEDATFNGVFYLLNGDKITVPMMRQTESFGYAEGDGYQVVELPYDGRELSMLVLLPQTGQFELFEESLNAQRVDDIVKNLNTREVVLTIPKFEFESSFGLKKTLTAMGMPVAFSAGADFSGMTGNPDLFIGEVLHKAFVSVDEAGTEAAAATAVIMELTAMPGEPVEVTIDRPFIFLIRDIESGTILFIGRVVNPGV
ncbi:hypothetical protein ES708_06368 [subsurface metagenome]